MATFATFTLELEITDAAALIRAAEEFLRDIGVDPEPGEVTLENAVRFLLDTSGDLPGAEVQDSTCETFEQ